MTKRFGRYRTALLAGVLALAGGIGAAHAETVEAEEAPQQQERVEPKGGLVLHMAQQELVQHEPIRAQAQGHAGHDHAGHDDHGGHAQHKGHDEHDASAPPAPINWFTGLIGEKEGVEPGLLWRAPGTPAPFAATLFNFSVFVFLVVRFGAKPLAAALTKRKDTIMRDIDEAARMRQASEDRLREYELRLEKIEEDLERVRREFREAGEHERQRILAEANERRVRMKEDAEFLLSQELKQMRQDLLHETVDQAVRGAAELLGKKLTPIEQERYLESFLTQLPARTGSGKGSEAAAAKGGLS